MKINRNYRFTLTVVNVEDINKIEETELTGEKMFTSECHYYVEKNIIETLKEADKVGEIDKYYNFLYCIYKEDKAVKKVKEYEKDGKKIIETSEIPGAAKLVETISITADGIFIR